MGTASSLSPGTPKRSPEAILHRVVGSSFSFVGSSFGCNGRVGGVVESRVQIGFGSVDGRVQIRSRFVDGFFGGGFAAASGQTQDDRKGVGLGKGVSVRLIHGGRRIYKKKNT